MQDRNDILELPISRGFAASGMGCAGAPLVNEIFTLARSATDIHFPLQIRFRRLFPSPVP